MGILGGIPDIRSYRGPVPLARRRRGECWGGGASWLDAVREHQDLRLLIGVTGTRARMPLDHSLGREERLDLFTQNGNAFRLLDIEIRIGKEKDASWTDPHPFGTFSTKTKALKTKTNAGLAAPLCVRLLVTFL